jgi:hypothetical protein
MFEDPSMGGFTAKEHLGRLVLFEQIGHIEKVTTAFGANDAVRADVTVIDAPEGPTEFRGSLIFGAALVPTVARCAGRMLLGRVAQGTPPRPGQDPPWIINTASDADKQAAGMYVQNRNAGAFASPAVPQAAPVATPAPVAAPAQVAAPAPTTQQTVDVSQLTPEQLQVLLNMGKQ